MKTTLWPIIEIQSVFIKHAENEGSIYDKQWRPETSQQKRKAQKIRSLET
jgi:hypothetical protein